MRGQNSILEHSACTLTVCGALAQNSRPVGGNRTEAKHATDSTRHRAVRSKDEGGKKIKEIGRRVWRRTISFSHSRPFIFLSQAGSSLSFVIADVIARQLLACFLPTPSLVLNHRNTRSCKKLHNQYLTLLPAQSPSKRFFLLVSMSQPPQKSPPKLGQKGQQQQQQQPQQVKE